MVGVRAMSRVLEDVLCRLMDLLVVLIVAVSAVAIILKVTTFGA